MISHLRLLLFIGVFSVFLASCGFFEDETTGEPISKPAAPTAEINPEPKATEPITIDVSETKKNAAQKLSDQGVDLLVKRDLETARKMFEQALVIDPQNKDAQKSIAALNEIAKRRQNEKEDRDYSFSLTNRGIILMQEKKYREAIRFFERAITLYDNNQKAKDHRRRALAAMNEHNQQIKNPPQNPQETNEQPTETTLIAAESSTPTEIEKDESAPPKNQDSPTQKTSTKAKNQPQDIESDKRTCTITADAATIPKDLYTDIELIGDTPQNFMVGEVFIIKGKTTFQEKLIEDVIAFYSKADTESRQSVFTGTTDGKFFEIPVFFSEPGTYTLSVFPGKEGLSKAIEVEVIDSECNPQFSLTPQSAPTNISAKVIDGEAVFEWEDDKNSLFQLDFKQNHLALRLLVHGQTRFTPPYWLFEHFQPGEVTLTISGAIKTGPSSLHRSSNYKTGDTITFNAVEHVSRNTNKLNNVRLTDNFTIGETITISGRSEESLSDEMVIIDPSEAFLTSPLTITDYDFSGSYTPKTAGRHIFEINRDDHLSLFIGAAYLKGNIPLLPDYYDLYRRQKNPTEESLVNAGAKMRVYVNKERRERNLKELSHNDKLEELAQYRADDMCARDYFGHVTPDGKDVGDYLEAYDIQFTVGENLVRTETLQYGHESLMHSPAHRELIIEPSTTLIGMGFCRNENDKSITTVQLFGTP